LKRTLQREVETELARRLLRGEVRDGQHVTVDYRNHELVFEATSPGASGGHEPSAR
jgi:ATP-dependent Clp protease ATP-binding subunit ClpB